MAALKEHIDYFVTLIYSTANELEFPTTTTFKKPLFGMWFGALFLLSLNLLGQVPVVRSECSAPCVPGSEDLMKPKAHGTSETPVQENLRWGCDRETADRICVSRTKERIE
jgi:hypothetical protein